MSSSTTRNLRNFGRRRSDITWWQVTWRCPGWKDWLGREKLNVVAESGGKFVFTNLPLPNSTLLPDDATHVTMFWAEPIRSLMSGCWAGFRVSNRTEHGALAHHALGFTPGIVFRWILHQMCRSSGLQMPGIFQVRRCSGIRIQANLEWLSK